MRKKAIFCCAKTLSAKNNIALLFRNACKCVANAGGFIQGRSALNPVRVFFKILRFSPFPLVLFHCAILLAAGTSSVADTDVRETVIKDISVDGLSSISREELLGLLDMKVGEVLDPLKVRRGIKRAFLKGIFEDIEVYADADRTKVEVLVKERDRIRKVLVTGNDYFSDRDIRNIFPLKDGQILRRDLFDDAVKRLEEGLSERGFPRATAAIDISSTSNLYEKDLTIAVSEGKPLRIERIVVRGAPDEEVKGVMHSGEGDIYDQKAVRKDVEKIRAHYKGLGYLNPVVAYRFSDAGLYIDVSKGKKLSVKFEGNTVFSAKQLTKEMPFSDAGEVRDDLVEDAVRAITSLYFSKGYAFAQAAPVKSVTAEDTVELTFFIFEGERITVAVLEFPGMTLPEKNLKEVLPLKEGDDYNPELVSSDAEVIREFYIALGYLGVEVGSPDVRTSKDKATITIPVKEGPITVIDKVEIVNARSVPLDDIRKAIGLKQGAPYNEVDIADARLRVIDVYQERGFLDATVRAQAEFSAEKAQVTFEIQEGERTFFGKTIITGNTRTRREVLERELLHRESAPFSYGLLAKERQRLYKIGLFTDVRIEPLEQYDHQRDIHIDVAEGNAGSVEFGFGYSNFDKFTVVVDIGYKNLFGMNRQISLRVGYNSLEKLYAVNYVDPWFLEKQLQLKGTVFYTERDEKNIDTKVIMYRYMRRGVSLGLEKQYTPTTRGELYYEFVLADTTDVQPDIILTEKDAGRLVISSIRPGVTYDTRDNPFDPRNGILLGLTMKVASAALLSEASFTKVVFNGSLYHELSKHFVLAAALRSGVARAWDPSEILPLAERFFLGGRSTVRGYAQDTLGPRGFAGNPTGGNAFVETNLELRTSVGKGIGLVTFLDSGNVWQKASDVDWSLKHAVGVGLRYDTPVGPLRVDYGYKLKKEEGLSRSEIFFSIGQAF
jgi:outer membrane protein insertion porin family